MEQFSYALDENVTSSTFHRERMMFNDYNSTADIKPAIKFKVQLKGPRTSLFEVFTTDFPFNTVLRELKKRDLGKFVFDLEITPNAPGLDVKYFHEREDNDHIDSRFGYKTKITPTFRREIMISLLDSFTAFCNEKEIVWWIAHGTLLGWFWGQKLLPWDYDIDVQTSFGQLNLMYKYNQTLYRARYLLDINPNSFYRYHQPDNVIDARFIDTVTGLYVDITALAETSNETLSCKSPHIYAYNDIFPLHLSQMEGIEIWRPHKVMMILAKEYGQKSMTQTFYNGYKWDPDNLNWYYAPLKRFIDY